MISLTSIFASFRQDLRSSSRWDAFFAAFWVAGPILYLIERSPADAWLSLMVIAFIVRSVRDNEWEWLQENWVKWTGLFWSIGLVAAATSNNIGYSLGEAIVWIRFPLYAAACMFWIGNSPARLTMMFTIMAAAASIMIAFLAVEIWQSGGSALRLSGPYGDPIPGSFMGKAMMPLAIVLVATAMRLPFFTSLLPAIAAGGILIFTLLTGERVNTALCSIAIVLAAFVGKEGWRRVMIYTMLGIIMLAGIVSTIPGPSNRYLAKNPETTNYFNSAYWFSVRPGIVAALQNPVLGIGVGMHRLECATIADGPKWLTGTNDCHPHPHQFYVQMAEETGVLGLIAGILMVVSIIRTAAKGRTSANMIARLAWIPPALMFFPQPSADFFGQWNNLFLWFAVGLALAMARIQKKS